MQNKDYWKGIAAITFLLMVVFQFHSKYLSAATIDEEEMFPDAMNVRITMDLQDASLRDILKILSVQSQLNFVASEAVADRKLTLYMDNVILKDALDKIFQVNNLTYDFDPENNIFIVKDWGKPSIELATKVYFLKYMSVANSKMRSESGGSSAGGGVKEALTKVISEYGKMTEDPATNSIVVTDMPSKFPVIEQLIEKLDVAVPQVLIEVEMLDVSKAAADVLGMNWPQQVASLDMSFASRITSFPFSYFLKGMQNKERYTASSQTSPTGWTISGWTGSNFGPSILEIIGTQLTLDMLKTRSDTKFLARPKIFVLNNETAEIKLSAQEAIGKSSTTTEQNTTESVERAETGVSLKVTPQISLATGEVTMAIEPKVKETKGSAISLTGGQSLRDVEERSVKSTIRVRDGNTVVIGGLIRQKTPTVVTKVAFLGDLPFIGMLFRHKDTTGSCDREIIVFLTPKIVRSVGEPVLEPRPQAAKLFSEREQDYFNAGPDRKSVISQALGRYETR